ncbi:MAG: thiolase family protein [Gammaproteobacteria bacterium]|jgi:acetyl-CoA acetyltransferase|nr:thiolase family protein [Gammaproteobacteria bacterium]
MTDMGRVYGQSAMDFAVQAVALALDDAGLDKNDIDGLLISGGLCSYLNMSDAVSMHLQKALGMQDLKLVNEMNAYGATAASMLQYAALSCASGQTDAVVCVFADAPLQEKPTAGYGTAINVGTGIESLNGPSGILNAATQFAMAARQHMEQYGTTSEHLAEIAVSTRAWASMNPLAQKRDPITIADHQSSRMIADPLHLLDCCVVSNGGVAVIVTSLERARDLKQPPVRILGWGQGHPGDRDDRMIHTGARMSGLQALQMADVELGDIDIRQIYDCFTYTTLVTLEDYGYCAKGEGGEAFSNGRLGPGGDLPTNTGGGQLSGYYMWGMTPISEAIIQTRGQARERQVPKHDLTLVSGNGGALQYHASLVLGADV